jgi:osmotically-inducible protein OsmY
MPSPQDRKTRPSAKQGPELPITDRQSFGHDPRSFPGQIAGASRSARYGTGHGLGAVGSGVEGGAHRDTHHGVPREEIETHERVADRLLAIEALDPDAVRLKFGAGGEITLEGTIASEELRAEAESACAAVPGVRAVHNHLRVSSTPDRR